MSISKIVGTITSGGLLNEEIIDPKSQLAFYTHNNGFDGEKFESVVGFQKDMKIFL